MVRCLTSSSSEDSDSGPPPARPVAKKKPKRRFSSADPLATSESEDESPQRPMVRKKTPAAAAPAAQAEKKQKPSNSDSKDEPLPAPPAREEAQEPIDLTAPADRTASAFDCSSSEPNNLQLLATEPLVKMGFLVEEAAPALWFAGGNIPRATALLCLGVSPMSQPALEIRDSVRLSGKIHNLKVNYYDNAISRDLSNTLLRLLTAPISDGGGGLGLPAPRGGVRLSYYVGDPNIDPSWRPWSGPGASEGDSILGLIGYKLSLGLGYGPAGFTHAVAQLQAPGLKTAMGQHKDVEVDDKVPIAGLSLFWDPNESRPVRFDPSSHRTSPAHDMLVRDCSVYAMLPPTNEDWRHGLPENACRRISITFRRKPTFEELPGRVVKSFTDPDTVYKVTRSSCTCKSWQYTPCWKKKYLGFRCKHMKALFPEE